MLIFFLARYQSANINQLKVSNQEQIKKETEVVAKSFSDELSIGSRTDVELEQGKTGNLLEFIAKDANAETLANYINTLGNNSDKLTQEIDRLIKSISDMGSYGELDFLEKEFYKKSMSYLQLLNYYQDATSFIDKGYAHFSDLSYEDGIIDGKVDILSPEYVKKYDTTYQSPDLPSIGKLVNGMPFTIIYFAHLGQWTDYEYNNNLPRVDVGQHVLNQLDRVTVEEETSIVPSYMLSGPFSGIKVDEGYYIARNKRTFVEIRIRTLFYVSMFNYQIGIRQSSNNSLLFICFPTKETAKKSKWLLEHAEELGIKMDFHINNEGEIKPDEVYGMYEKVKEVIDNSKEDLGDIEDEFSTMFNQ